MKKHHSEKSAKTIREKSIQNTSYIEEKFSAPINGLVGMMV